ncbi:MAG: ribbon-helix-helix domain-containing protein [Bifidobacteriaceae bacterium]|nr:ribbon-helix-helix domain-containing protein [Bifidobacteriaceae bacterium]
MATAPPNAQRFTHKTITVPTDLLEDVDQIVGGGNLSAFVSDALRQAVQSHHRREILAEYEAEHGLVPAEEVAALAQELASA